jgi:menaquinone-dependent protoporphyrinogen IX oxidase
VLSNSRLSLGQARLLAKTLSAEVGMAPAAESSRKFITAAFEQILSRPPTGDETAACQRFLDKHARLLQQKGLTAFAVTAKSAAAPSADPQQRARENLVHVLYNHNDFVTIR